ncbi:MAG: hypothetical protein HFG13_00030 [Oscillibacter sp.]|nr:hypothetical protein [Oscillibacter sp.]
MDLEMRNLEQVKRLTNDLDDYSREGPPTEERVRQMRDLTGIDWTAEEQWRHCFAYTSRASLEETAYLMFHKEYPPVYQADPVFWKCLPGIVLDEKEIYKTYRLGRGTLKALEPLPLEEILEKIGKLFPGWTRYPDAVQDGKSWRFVCP